MKAFSCTMLLLLSSVTAGAQTIKDGSGWTDGSVLFQAHDHYTSSDGYHTDSYKFEGWSPHEGGFEFILQPQAKAGEYRLSADESDFVPLNGAVGYRVQRVSQDGLDLLIVRNDEGRATDFLRRVHPDVSIINICEQEIITLLRGTYRPSQRTQGNGSPDTRWVFTDTSVTSGIDGKTYPLRLEQIWDQPQPIVELGGKLYQFVPSVRGLNVYACRWDEESEEYIVTGEPTCLEWADPSRSRFQFLSEQPCSIAMLNSFDKQGLRLMRNDIMARHGYTFQSADLREHFAQQPWYRPAANNAAIRLSFVEELNVELIQSLEYGMDEEEL